MNEFSVTRSRPKSQQASDDCLECRKAAGFTTAVKQQSKSVAQRTTQKPASTSIANTEQKLKKLYANLKQKEIILNQTSEYNHCVQNETKQKTSAKNKATATAEFAKAQADYNAALKAVNEAEGVVTVIASKPSINTTASVEQESGVVRNIVEVDSPATTRKILQRLDARPLVSICSSEPMGEEYKLPPFTPYIADEPKPKKISKRQPKADAMGEKYKLPPFTPYIASAPKTEKISKRQAKDNAIEYEPLGSAGVSIAQKNK